VHEQLRWLPRTHGNDLTASLRDNGVMYLRLTGKATRALKKAPSGWSPTRHVCLTRSPPWISGVLQRMYLKSIDQRVRCCRLPELLLTHRKPL
jgi:hypothetical protein